MSPRPRLKDTGAAPTGAVLVPLVKDRPEDLLDLPEWTAEDEALNAEGLCRGITAFTTTGDRTTEDRERIAEAKRLCARCPVANVCFAVCERIERPYPYNAQFYGGIWAGETPAERAERRKKRSRKLKKRDLEPVVRAFVTERYKGVQLVGGHFNITHTKDLDEFVDRLCDQFQGISAVLERDGDTTDEAGD